MGPEELPGDMSRDVCWCEVCREGEVLRHGVVFGVELDLSKGGFLSIDGFLVRRQVGELKVLRVLWWVEGGWLWEGSRWGRLFGGGRGGAGCLDWRLASVLCDALRFTFRRLEASVS